MPRPRRYMISPYRQQPARGATSRPAEVGGKQQRYRARQVQAGRCPHCGQPCAPYYECADRRLYKRLQFRLGRGLAAALQAVDDTEEA